MTTDILDFTDYAKPVDFKYQDVIYRVPPFDKSQIETLMAINRKFISIGGSAADEPTLDTENIDAMKVDEKIDASNQYFDMQDEFLSCAILKKDGEGFKPIESTDITGWPVKVKNRIMKIINEQMSTTIDDDVTEKKS